jgi:uncharacterized RDD family membrane protein YckC
VSDVGSAADPAEHAIPREARPYQGHRAGIASRFLANSIDLGVILASLAGIYLGWVGLQFLIDPRAGASWPTVSGWLILIAYFVVAVLYLAVGWWLTGRTVGKSLIGLRVLGARRARMYPVAALLRAAFCVFFPIGLFWVVLSDENRSLADTVLRSSVIYDWRRNRQPDEREIA